MDAAANGISELLARDHRVLEGLLARAKELMTAGDLAGAHEAFLDYAGALESHILFEERVVFPPIEQAPGTAYGPTAIMRYQHQRMESLLAEILASLTDHAAPWLALASLETLARRHEETELGAVYPLADTVVPASWRSHRP
jgi:iron-sulfur cluster repair protein YtfE (RIC family)